MQQLIAMPCLLSKVSVSISVSLSSLLPLSLSPPFLIQAGLSLHSPHLATTGVTL